MRQIDPNRPFSLASLAMFLTCATWVSHAQGETIVLQPVADATLIQSADSSQYALGAAYNIYCGRVGVNGAGTLRRALLRYDLSAIPANATISSVSLKVYMSQTTSGSQTTQLRRVLESWGEGTSFAFGGAGTSPDLNDATWMHRMYPTTFWSIPGGVFAAATSASKSIGSAGAYVFQSTATMVSDVQGWISTPASNFGWIMIGNEAVLETAKRFESRESADPARRPLLTIVYTAPVLTGDLNHDGRVDGSDLGLLLAGWGAPGATDIDGNGATNGADLALLLGNWQP